MTNKGAVKILKYKELSNRNTAHVECTKNLVPVITGATETIPKLFTKYLSNTARKHENKELQKTAILGTAHILRKVLM